MKSSQTNTPKKSNKGLLIGIFSCLGCLGIIIVIVIIIAVVGAGSKSTQNTNTSTQTAQTPAEPVDTHPHFKDGTYKVGTDIQPGTYRTRTGSSNCYYERMKDFSGGINSILSNDNTSAPAVVTILPTDAGFKSTNCGTWTQDLSAITKSQTSFSDGIYIVGTDFQPGTYKSSGQTGCYWSRLADFTGGINSILANDNTDTAAIVNISATDKGFKASNCGTWAKTD